MPNLSPRRSSPEAYDKTFIIESDLLRVLQVRQGKLKAIQQYFILEAWGDAFEVDEL